MNLGINLRLLLERTNLILYKIKKKKLNKILKKKNKKKNWKKKSKKITNKILATSLIFFKQKNQKYSNDFWHWKMTLKIKVLQFWRSYLQSGVNLPKTF